MDPYYFLDLTFENFDEGEDLELHDYTNISPDGCWDITMDDTAGRVIYKGKEYTEIRFDNYTKIITFYENDVLKLTVELKLI